MKKKPKTIVLVGDAHGCLEIRYLTGYAAVDPAILVKQGNRTILVVGILDVMRARKQTRGVEVLSPADFKFARRNRRNRSALVIAAIRELGTRSVSVPTEFPVGIARDMEAKGIRVSVEPSETLIDRSVKSVSEIRKIAAVQRAAVAGMRAAERTLKKARPDSRGILRLGRTIVTSESLRDVIEGVLFEHGCDATETIVAGGRQAVDPHEAGHGPLRAGESIVIDIFPQNRKSGYWGDLTRTFVRGKATSSLRDLYKAVKTAQIAALRRVKPGVNTNTVHRAAAAEFEARGYRTGKVKNCLVGFRHGLGHGVGLRVHESPSVASSGERLRKGHVITIEPGLYYPDIGGVRIEDTIVVTKNGWRYLAPCEKTLEL
jgi:Xaa-Pro aminopeptidase